MDFKQRSRWMVTGILTVIVASSSMGCVRLAANLLHAFKGNDKPAEFKGLEGKRVAVVCGTDGGLSSDSTAILMGRYVRRLLEENVKDIEIVRQDEVDQWLNTNGWDQMDYIQIGRGVKADLVVGIDVMHLSLTDGATLYQGRSDITTTVYEVSRGNRPVFRREIPDFVYPAITGQPATDTDEAKFKRTYLLTAANRAARYFYPSDFADDFALDAAAFSQ